MKKLLTFAVILMIGCASFPTIKYTPLTYGYPVSQKIELDSIKVYFKHENVPYRYKIIGEGYASLYGYTPTIFNSFKSEYTVEEGIEALRKEALKRKADAIINIEVRSGGGIVPGTLFTESRPIVVKMVMCDFVVIEK